MKTLIVLLLLLFTLNASSLRISAQTLNQDVLKYKILDTRSLKDYQAGHIHGAINFDVAQTYSNMELNGKLTDPLEMQNIIQLAGLNIEDNVVIYDNGSFFDAARLFWALEVYGFTNVKLLTAGYKQWLQKGLKTTTKVTSVVQSDYITVINNKRLATKFSTQIATKNPNHIIIDARPTKAYIGKVSVAQRFGHIPKATNIPASHNIDKSSNISILKDVEILKDIYKNISKDKKVVIYCALGKISATNYFALRELDYDVSNYDASWKEWGNDLKLPIVNPSQK
ncbi:sulfurtransferase [Sulfurimonas sp.]|jgi:thiosulfate/3-mercaptopyruvate sulfurtransferase|uniref:sulfurtransferase n=1 Tax=Sulfurimonas sp. TaxID=2022749 RepID=UPI0025E1AA34|nr:rhodanese-like domain-containing protein [Sulfurimonas sp.]MBT5935425.1 sulfurtransferase [Sulfurimonas sp.]